MYGSYLIMHILVCTENIFKSVISRRVRNILRSRWSMQNLRVLCASGICCSRWYFTFDDRECTGPMTIEGTAQLQTSQDNPHRHCQIECYCENIPEGEIRVGLHIGQCSGKPVNDDDAGSSSVSRIMIVEVPPAQPICTSKAW